MKETQWQSKICARVRNEGGYAKKWATHLTVGVPDLVMVLPKIGGIGCEVKLEKDWTSDTERTIAVTEKQSENLNEYHDAGGVSCVLLVVYNGIGKVHMSIHRPPPRRGVLKVRQSEATDPAMSFQFYKDRRDFVDFLTEQLRLKCR